MGLFRLLRADEIECRMSQIKKNGVQLLLYKNARTDMDLLDETFGPMNWMRHHTRDNANCIISIWDEDKGQWVDKEDVGTESNTEAQKGLASDSFKRAGVNWGIGRELYTSPFIWISNANCEIKEDLQGRFRCNDRFEVKEIGYNEHREINCLVIINSKSQAVVYEYGTAEAQKGASKRPKPKTKEEYSPTGGKAERADSEAPTVATEEQKAYIREHASDEDYMDIMQEFGAELENLSYEDAKWQIKRIDDNNASAVPKCERCNKIITGIALPDGTTMKAPELIAKSKLTYNGIYCYECMKVLNKKRKAG